MGLQIQVSKSLEKPLLLGKIEGKRRRERLRIRWLESITDSMDMNLIKLQEIVEDREGWHAVVHGVLRSQTLLSDWTNHWKCFLCNSTRWRKVLTYFELIHPSLLEKTLEIPLDCKEIKPVNPKGNRSWIFIGKTDAEAEAPILWPPDVKCWLVRKDPDAGSFSFSISPSNEYSGLVSFRID